MSTIYLQWSANISRTYGRKQGLLRHYSYRLVHLLGGYGHFQRIDWARVTRLVFACSGNICRSAYAEAKARALGLTASSFGLNAEINRPVDPIAFKVGLQRGMDLSAHMSRSRDQFTSLSGDLLVGMEPWHGKVLRNLSGELDTQITLLGLWHSYPRPHIEDPYRLGEEYMATCFSVIDDALENIALRMKTAHVW